MQKTVSNYKHHYVSTLTPAHCQGYLLFVHGGPGAHSAYFEVAVQELPAYREGSYGWICYDQRECGRSPKTGKLPTHEENIADLAALLRHFHAPKNNPGLKAIVGHSYGGWLAAHTLSENPELALPLVVVGTAQDLRTAKNHSFAMDMLELRLDQPEVYAKLLPELEGYTKPLWEFQKRIREVAAPLTRRPYFLWGNLQTMDWYQKLKDRVGVAESWEYAHKISAEISAAYLLKRIRPEELKAPVLWILGAHDLLMDGDQHFPGEKGPVTTFLQSGHYPHFEEPTRFIRELGAFLKT